MCKWMVGCNNSKTKWVECMNENTFPTPLTYVGARQALTHVVGPKYHSTWQRNVHTCLFGAGRVLHFLRKSWSFGKVTQPRPPHSLKFRIINCIVPYVGNFYVSLFPSFFLSFFLESIKFNCSNDNHQEKGNPLPKLFYATFYEICQERDVEEHLTTMSKWVLGICHETLKNSWIYHNGRFAYFCREQAWSSIRSKCFGTLTSWFFLSNA